ncbi:MAG TPA: PriCT-2 domain-containing protein [Sphingomicrobium sp.]|jgi:primase-polymerase (primpol)-like protein|nr:PriCT-2 domain-containing protein [Sphingomicrobium sp.]
MEHDKNTDALSAVLPDQLLEQPIFLLAHGKKPRYASGTFRNGELDGPQDLGRLVQFDQAVAKANTFKWCDGIGIAVVEGKGFVVADLDHCLDEAGGLIPTHPGYALAIEARAAGAYVERSVSGQGLHIIAPCSVEFDGTDLAKGLSIYAAKRFIRLTGDLWEGATPKGWIDLGQLDALNTVATARRTRASDFEPVDPEDVTEETWTELESALAAISPEDRDVWVDVGQALRPLEQRGFEVWKRWSMRSAKWSGANPTGDLTSIRPGTNRAVP